MTLVDIRNEAAHKLNSGFPGYYLYYDVLPQDFSMPCFLMQILSVSKTNENLYQFLKALTFNIRYYPDEGVSTGLLEMQDKLEELFDMALQAGDRSIGIDRTKGEILEKVLHFTFDLSYTDSREDMNEGLEMMQTLEMKEEF
ncbi:MAG: hypothetical protein VB106_15985 [Clostridiaceae bacterium]|nr:hypothetical protein [Clostridiaceae bacterium]